MTFGPNARPSSPRQLELRLELPGAHPYTHGDGSAGNPTAKEARLCGDGAIIERGVTADNSAVARLYSRQITAGRSGPLYNAFSYPTKIDPEAIAIFVAAHTCPGDTVLDVFAGSGTTGLAVRLCEQPTERMRRRVQELGLQVEWGPRSAVLYELGVVGSLLARVMCDPPDPIEFAKAARDVLATASDRLDWMYVAEGPDGAPGWIRHTIWTDLLICGTCGNEASFWDLAVSRRPLQLRKTTKCHRCNAEIITRAAVRVVEPTADPLTGESTLQRVRRVAYVYGRTGRRTWQRPPKPSDLELIERVLETDIPDSVPSMPIHWGDLRRTGYHQGIDRIHDFYTRRNLIAFGALWEAVERQPLHLRDPLRLLLLSYNTAHATLMTRVVVKKGMSDFIVTGAQSGVLYISSLPVEKNVFQGIARKANTFCNAFAVSGDCSGVVRVVNASSTELDLPDRSVDYIFTDPPFGGFIPYAEINQINEAWLGSRTDIAEEAIISPAQGKGVREYATLMKNVFAEVSRVMKDHAVATTIFHASTPEVWGALGEAFAHANLAVRRTSVLDKTQVSFKQVVSQGSTRGDAIFLLSKGSRRSISAQTENLRSSILELRKEHGTDLTPQHLYSRYVARCMEDGQAVELSANAFYAELRLLDGSLR